MKSRTFIVSKGEVHIPSCLCGEGEEEAMPAGRFIFIHCTYGFNDLDSVEEGVKNRKMNTAVFASLQKKISTVLSLKTLQSCHNNECLRL